MELPGDPTYWTYFMVDWESAQQSPSEQKCVQCGREMKLLEGVTDRKAIRYDGLVCHTCKRVVWVRVTSR